VHPNPPKADTCTDHLFFGQKKRIIEGGFFCFVIAETGDSAKLKLMTKAPGIIAGAVCVCARAGYESVAK